MYFLYMHVEKKMDPHLDYLGFGPFVYKQFFYHMANC